MYTIVIDDTDYYWYSAQIGDARILVKGIFWHTERYYREERACRKIHEMFSPLKPTEKELKSTLQGLKGHFSFIIDTPDYSLAVVDRIRSYPIFYHQNDNRLFFSNSAARLRTQTGLTEKDSLSALEFEMAGYVTGKQTLFKHLFQLQSGEILFCEKNKSSVEYIRYYRYWSDNIVERSEDELLSELHRVLNKTFSSMVETLQGRPVWIPLSGGLDSRLVLAMLLELKYDNITTFSYGVPGLWEIKRARAITEHLKVKWHYIPYHRREIKKLFHTKEREKYFDFASGLCTVPALSGWYVIWLMKNRGMIPENAILINGQSGDFLDGGHIPQVPDTNAIEVRLLLEAIISKHFSLWENLKTKEYLEIIAGKLLILLHLPDDMQLSQSEMARYYEMIEWQERQSKYVVNGQRMYDWFGYAWRLPLWSDELMEFWLNVDWRTKRERNLTKKYLERFDPAGSFNSDWPAVYSYAPFPIKILNKLLLIFSRLTNNLQPELLYQTFTKYFMTHSYLYPQRSYFEYLKTSRWHRSPVSYFSKMVVNLANHPKV